MKLYLVRHGEAQPAGVDAARPLSPRGRIQIERLARWAVEAGVAVSEIRHSGKTRAQETALILAAALKPARGARAATGLNPNDDFSRIADDTVHETSNLMLVGHLPFLGLLAEHLLRGKPGAGAITFPPGGLISLEFDGSGWSLEHVIDPDRQPESGSR